MTELNNHTFDYNSTVNEKELKYIKAYKSYLNNFLSETVSFQNICSLILLLQILKMHKIMTSIASGHRL